MNRNVSVLLGLMLLAAQPAGAANDDHMQRLKIIFDDYAPTDIAWLEACGEKDAYADYLDALGRAASKSQTIDTFKFVSSALSNADREAKFMGLKPMLPSGAAHVPTAEECAKPLLSAIQTKVKLEALAR